MSMTYQLPPGVTLRVAASSGDVTVIAEERKDIEAPDGAEVWGPGGQRSTEESRGRTERRRRRHKKSLHRFLHKLAGVKPQHEAAPGPVLEIKSARGGSGDIVVRCPTGTPISVGTISGDVTLEGEFGDTSVATTSGDVSIDRAAALDVRSVSGDLEIVGCGGRCRLHTKSGHISVGEAGPAEAATVSGSVRLDKTTGKVTVRTVSGSVELRTEGKDPVSVRTVSGRTTVRVEGKRLPDARLRTLSGKVACDCPPGSDFPLEVTSISGGIEVGPT
jgi:DUF4097 and DUF4098 domain-containing protein YvlB